MSATLESFRDKTATFLAVAKKRDRIARYVIVSGGILVIATVLAILASIVRITFPLFDSGDATKILATKLSTVIADPHADVIALGSDEYLENFYLIDRQGKVHFASFDAKSKTFAPGPVVALGGEDKQTIRFIEKHHDQRFSILWDNGLTDLITFKFKPVFDLAQRRTIEASVEVLVPASEWPAEARDLKEALVRQNEQGSLSRVLIDRSNAVIFEAFSQESGRGGLFQKAEIAEKTLISRNFPKSFRGNIVNAALSENGKHFVAVTDAGDLLRAVFSDRGELIEDQVQVIETATPFSAVSFVFGDQTLVAADTKGQLQVFAVSVDSNQLLVPVKTLGERDAATTVLRSSRRNKMMVSLENETNLHFDYVTNERELVEIKADAAIKLFAPSPRDNALMYLTKNGEFVLWSVSIAHPEVSFSSFFEKVHYEGYGQAEFVWQSSSGRDEFEPKFSLVPLIFGTLKGTMYGMLLAFPLAFFAAIYISQFSSARVRKVIKPAIELMAALPSVVIGFLLALWFAPILQNWILVVFISLVTIPLFFLAFVFVWDDLRQLPALRWLERGFEFVVLTPVILLAVFAAVKISTLVEQSYFGGNFLQWLYSNVGTVYDQRNCVIIAFGLGFVVIPIIFSIAEDSLSSVPRNLIASSLALGASRWQTVWRIVVPAASPGIFAATMVGFGRAVGETMIVLMATGNTPILDLSIFNGMRTLSANIAVEIPEAPVDSTLYRTLFLCAVILFGFTFCLNTGAELIRHRLRGKYARF